MMRSLTPLQPEPELVRLCREGRWSVLLERLNMSSRNVESELPLVTNGHSVGGDAITSSPNLFSCEPLPSFPSFPLLQVAIRATCHFPRHTGGASLNDTSSTGRHGHLDLQETLPIRVIQALIQANPHQLAVINQWTGTLLHEAIQYRCSNQAIDCILQAIKEYVGSSTSFARASHANIIQEIEKEERSFGDSAKTSSPQFPYSLLGVQDDVGRTALHCFVARWQRSFLVDNRDNDSLAANASSSTTNASSRPACLSDVELFRRLLWAHPAAATTVDSDGHTPLLMLLQTTSLDEAATITFAGTQGNSSNDNGNDHRPTRDQELELQQMVAEILLLDPTAARQTRQSPAPPPPLSPQPNRGDWHLQWNSSSSIDSHINGNASISGSKASDAMLCKTSINAATLTCASANTLVDSSLSGRPAAKRVAVMHCSNSNSRPTSSSFLMALMSATSSVIHRNHHLSNEQQQDQQQSSRFAAPDVSTFLQSVSSSRANNSPLYYAILYGRSAEIIKLLLDAAAASAASSPNAQTASLASHVAMEKSSPAQFMLASKSTSVIVTPYHEVTLHIAVSTSAPIAVVEYVVQDNPYAVTVCDVYNLTPLDWLWICHVRDWPRLVEHQHHAERQQQQQVQPNGQPVDRHQHLNANGTRVHRNPLQLQWRRLVSGRRHVPRLLLDLHNLASAHVPNLAGTTTKSPSKLPTTADAAPAPHRINGNRPAGNRRRPHHNGTRGQEEASVLPPATSIHPELIIRHQDDLLCRMKVLVIAAAESYAEMESSSSSRKAAGECSKEQSWSFLHAVCYVPCPRAMVRLVLLRHSGDSSGGNMEQGLSLSESYSDPQLRRRDGRAGRLPLHYAASRVGYTATFSTGFSGTVQVIQESSPVLDVVAHFPEACRVADEAQQLPLHIAIDAFKQHRVGLGASTDDSTRMSSTPSIAQGQSSSSTASNTNENRDDEEDKVLRLLLDHYPSALDRRDGKTKLFPWQQAAVGRGSQLSTIYFLLRSNPSLCQTKSL